MPRRSHLLCCRPPTNQRNTQLALVPISREIHARTKVRPLSSLSFARETATVQVCGAEIAAIGQELPVVFARSGDGFIPVALLGFRPQQNLLIDPQGRWLGHHLPAVWRRGPFRLAHIAGEAEGKMALCLDDSDEHLNESEGQSLFDESGAPTALVNTASALLTQIERDARMTHALCATLDRFELIVPWDLDITQPDGTAQRVGGLFRVDEARIATLSADALVEVRDAGALPVIYAHLLSLSKISTLGRLARLANERTQQQTAMQNGNLNLDRAFGIVEDDPFLF